MAEPFKTGNIGEHSELLAVARVIVDGYLELGVPDEVGPLSPKPKMEVYGVSRTPPLGTKFPVSKKKDAVEEEVKSRDVYISNGEDVLIVNEPSGSSRRLCARTELAAAAQGLQQQLIYWSSEKFKSEKRAQKAADKKAGIKSKTKALRSEHSQRILDLLGLTALRAKSGAKSDLYLTMESSSKRRIPQGFSVKSQMGSKSCLVNHSGATIFKFEVLNATLAGVTTLEDGHIYNKAVAAKKPESAATATRGPSTLVPALLGSPGVSIKFDSVVSSTFKENLEMIDSHFPEALGMVILHRFKTGKSKIADLADEPDLKKFLVSIGMSQRVAESYLAEKLKDLLRKFALGMQANTPWRDQAEVQGGWVLVVEDGKVVGYRFDNPDAFRSYLIKHTMIDTPSTSRVSKNSAKVGRAFEQDGKIFMTLSLIVKFTE
jgi:hypothetical protein